jgi:hypothetical protein
MQPNEVNQERMFKTLGKQGIRTRHSQGKQIVEIDPAKAQFRGMKVKDLGAFGRRKFENLVFIEHSHNRKMPTLLSYKP